MAGEAIRIFTGAPMPAGADTVFMQEDCRVEGDAVIVPPGLKRGANRRLAGEDMRAGAVALPAGRRLAVQHVALAAALGLTALTCAGACAWRCSRPATRSSSRARTLPRAALYDSNRYLLAGLHRALRRRSDRSRHSQRRSEGTRAGAQSRAPQTMIWC